MASVLLVLVYLLYVAVVYFWKRIKHYEDTESGPEAHADESEKISNWVPGIVTRINHFLSRFPYLVFLMSVGMISLLSWILVKSAVGISAILGVPELIIGLTIVAVGTSVPDLISSMIVAKQGRPGMAINNALGSNIFDILIGLGLPFLIYMVFNSEGFALESQDLVVSVVILLSSALVLLIYFLLVKWHTSRSFGIALLMMYLVYLGYVIVTAL